jgi:hypothetical protein
MVCLLFRITIDLHSGFTFASRLIKRKTVGQGCIKKEDEGFLSRKILKTAAFGAGAVFCGNSGTLFFSR